MDILLTLLLILGAYVIGSFPTGYLLVKAVKGQDIREIGSGNTGATNVKRVLGKRGFAFVLLVDAIKGYIPVFLGEYIEKKYGILTSWHVLPVLASFAVIIGHSKSIFLKFSGGKSVATTAGVGWALDWRVALTCYIWFAITAYISKYISFASITTMVLMVLTMYFINGTLSYVIFCSITAIYVIYLHRENIKRLLSGTENKVR